jgi:hypothetical protein
MNREAFIGYLFITGFTKTNTDRWANYEKEYVIIFYHAGVWIQHNHTSTQFGHYGKAQKYLNKLLDK